MRWFGTRRRVDLGTYEAPPVKAPPTVESIVTDAVLISESVVRMTLRNRIVVDALRDRRDVDRHRLQMVAAAEYEALADNEWETAQRLRMGRELIRNDDPLQEFQLTTPERKEGERRERVHRAVSDAFAGRAADGPALDRLVERSIEEAWSEVAPVLAAKAQSARGLVVEDADYGRARDGRIRELVSDLEELAARLGERHGE